MAIEVRPTFADDILCRRCGRIPKEVTCATFANEFRIRLQCHGDWYVVTVTFQEIMVSPLSNSLRQLVQIKFDRQVRTNAASQPVEEKIQDTHLVKPMRKIDLE